MSSESFGRGEAALGFAALHRLRSAAMFPLPTCDELPAPETTAGELPHIARRLVAVAGAAASSAEERC
eukprot:5057623-Prymnesium_polylepis.1